MIRNQPIVPKDTIDQHTPVMLDGFNADPPQNGGFFAFNGDEV